MLTIYPLSDYDSFCSITDADTILTNNVPSTQRTLWDALTVVDKEIYTRQATTLIRQRITLPETLETDLKRATAYLANHSISKNMLDDDSSDNIKEKSIDGVVKTVYFNRGESSNAFPSLVESLLSQYNSVSDSSFVFQRA
jgi:hypothetical protein